MDAHRPPIGTVAPNARVSGRGAHSRSAPIEGVSGTRCDCRARRYRPSNVGSVRGGRSAGRRSGFDADHELRLHVAIPLRFVYRHPGGQFLTLKYVRTQKNSAVPIPRREGAFSFGILADCLDRPDEGHSPLSAFCVGQFLPAYPDSLHDCDYEFNRTPGEDLLYYL